MARTKPRKWIANRKAELDPYEDYEELMKLSIVYRSNDTFMDLIYSITFPNFVVPNTSALAILRDGKGKVARNPGRRMDDTSRHILIWAEYGPDHPYTKKSVDSLNKVHSFYAKKFPGAFGDNEDYLYTLCYEATLFHRLLVRVGHKGFDENDKIASHIFYSKLAKLFINAETKNPIEGFPDDFESCVDMVEKYEWKKRPPNKYSNQVDEHLIQAFGKRHFPKPLQWIGRALVLSLLPEGTVVGLGIKPATKFTKAICRFGFRIFIWMGEIVITDPDITHPELLRKELGLPELDFANNVASGVEYAKTNSV